MVPAASPGETPCCCSVPCIGLTIAGALLLMFIGISLCGMSFISMPGQERMIYAGLGFLLPGLMVLAAGIFCCRKNRQIRREAVHQHNHQNPTVVGYNPGSTGVPQGGYNPVPSQGPYPSAPPSYKALMGT